MVDEVIFDVSIKKIMGLQHKYRSPNVYAKKINHEIHVITVSGKKYIIPAYLKKLRIYL